MMYHFVPHQQQSTFFTPSIGKWSTSCFIGFFAYLPITSNLINRIYCAWCLNFRNFNQCCISLSEGSAMFDSHLSVAVMLWEWHGSSGTSVMPLGIKIHSYNHLAKNFHVQHKPQLWIFPLEKNVCWSIEKSEQCRFWPIFSASFRVLQE